MRCPHCDNELPETFETRRESLERIKPKVQELHRAILKVIMFMVKEGRITTYQNIHATLRDEFNFKVTDTTVSSRLTELRQLNYVLSKKDANHRSTLNFVTKAGKAFTFKRMCD